MNLIKNKTCAIKNITNILTIQPPQWEKIFLNHVYDKYLESRIYKEF